LKPFSVYVHIPFCNVKCNYCDFYVVIKHEKKNPLLYSLLREIDYYAEIYHDKGYLQTIYFGGGTPSLVEPSYLQQIINKLTSIFKFPEDIEITIESNPNTIDEQKLKDFRSIGVNRLSIGVQSFNDEDLKYLTRDHDSKTALKSIEAAAKAGFDNINIDLMFSIPGQTLDEWKENLRIAVQQPIKHISAYSLTLEPGTSLYYQSQKGIIYLPSIEQDADMYEFTMDFLPEYGFQQYEVSNFAKPGYESIHNLNYWYRINYLGFGPSSHSLWDNRRWHNYRNISRYIENVNEKRNAIKDEEFLNPTEIYNERIYLGLRSRGINLKQLEEEFNINLLKHEERFFNELIKNGFCVVENDMLRLTKKGYLLVDEICEQLML
jgi:oxygen-independent coproporphyrinogen-3 oxidase